MSSVVQPVQICNTCVDGRSMMSLNRIAPKLTSIKYGGQKFRSQSMSHVHQLSFKIITGEPTIS